VNATKVNAGPAESNGRLLLGIWRDSLHVTCGLTACTPRSAPGPTLGNEYGKTLPFYCIYRATIAYRNENDQTIKKRKNKFWNLRFVRHAMHRYAIFYMCRAVNSFKFFLSTDMCVCFLVSAANYDALMPPLAACQL